MIASYKTQLLKESSFTNGKQTVKNTPQKLALAKASMQKAADSLFKEEIAQAERLLGLPKEFFLPFGEHETGWRNVQNSAGSSASGPMQIMPNSAVGVICASSSFINADTRKALVRLLGETRANGYLKPGMTAKNAMNKFGKISASELLQKPELSILCAVMLLGYLCRKNTKNGKIDIIRVLLQYSEGEGSKLVTNTPQAQLTEIKLRHSKQSYNYAVSMVGQYGLMTAFNA